MDLETELLLLLAAGAAGQAIDQTKLAALVSEIEAQEGPAPVAEDGGTAG